MFIVRTVIIVLCITFFSACGGGSSSGGQVSSSARSLSSSSVKSSSSSSSLSLTSASSDSSVMSGSLSSDFSFSSVILNSSSSTDSSSSNISSSSVSSESTILPPKNLLLTSGYAKITASWGTVAEAETYNLYYAKESFSNITVLENYASLTGAGLTENIAATNFTQGGLENNVVYYMVVTAKSSENKESEPSGEKSATPAASAPTPTPTPFPTPSGETIACSLRSEGGLCDEFMPLVSNGRRYEIKGLNAAGKTFCMQPSNTAKGILVENVMGADGAPVKIVNCGGKVTLNTIDWQRGINVLNSRYVHITGTGSAEDFYGIHIINTGGAGVDATNGTSDFEIDHVQIDAAGGSGILVRTYPFSPDCHMEWTRPNFTQYNTSIHDNFVNGSRWEGLYVGTSHYDQADGPSGTSCGAQSAPQASLVGVKIFNNRIENTGNDGIQLGGAISGVEVYNNTVKNYALHNSNQHAGGLQLNPGTGGKFYNNYIQAHPDADTAQGLMYIGGETPLYVYNNIFVGGSKAIMTLNRMSNSTHFVYTNNTYYGDGLGNTFYFFCNLLPEIQRYTIKNNIFTNYNATGSNVTGGWNYFNGSQGGQCPMNGVVISGYADNESDLHMSNNYFSKSPAELLFVNELGGDYTLRAGSPAVGMGANLNITLPLPSE